MGTKYLGLIKVTEKDLWNTKVRYPDGRTIGLVCSCSNDEGYFEVVHMAIYNNFHISEIKKLEKGSKYNTFILG